MGEEHENHTGDVRYGFIYEGPIIDRADPMQLGRVKVRIPGLFDPTSPWVLPCGMPGSGGMKRGLKWVPPLGAEVAVFFKGGDPNQPRYMSGPWGKPSGASEIPTDAQVDDHAEDIIALETERFAITIDDRPGKENLVIKDKRTGDSFELDGVAPGVQIKGTAAIILKCDGMVSIEALRILLNGRTVGPGTSQI